VVWWCGVETQNSTPSRRLGFLSLVKKGGTGDPLNLGVNSTKTGGMGPGSVYILSKLFSRVLLSMYPVHTCIILAGQNPPITGLRQHPRILSWFHLPLLSLSSSGLA